MGLRGDGVFVGEAAEWSLFAEEGRISLRVHW